MTYRPSWPVATLRVSDVPTLRTMTVTPGSALRLGSSTVPLMVAAVCAEAWAASTGLNRTDRTGRTGRRTRTRISAGLQPEDRQSRPSESISRLLEVAVRVINTLSPLHRFRAACDASARRERGPVPVRGETLVGPTARIGWFIAITAVYLLHQDIWLWRQPRPLVFGFLPPALAYHGAY